MKVRYLILLYFISVLLASCDTNKYLTEGQTYIKNVSVKVDNDEPIPGKAVIVSKLQSVPKQHPNTKVWFVNRRWYYLAKKDSKHKFGQWLYKTFAEPPQYFDSTQVAKSRERITTYMAEQGFYQAEVLSEVTPVGKHQTAIEYTVRPGDILKVKKLVYQCEDSILLDIIKKAAADSYLKVGQVVNEANYNQEVARITALMRDNGYALFSPLDISELSVNITNQINEVKLDIIPVSDFSHRKFTFGEIHFVLGAENEALDAVDDTLRQIRLSYAGEKPFVAPERLIKKLEYFPNQQYNKTNIDETSRLYNRLPYFRSAHIQSIPDTTDQTIDTKVVIHRTSKMAAGFDIEVSNSNNGEFGQRQSILGLSGGLNFQHRNLFGGGEELNFNTDYGVEFNIGKNSGGLINSRSFDINADLIFPEYIEFFPWLRLLRQNVDAQGRVLNGFNIKDAITKVTGNYSQSKIINFYDNDLINARFGTDWGSRDNRKRINIDYVGFNYFHPSNLSEFIRQNELLRNRFTNSLSTGFIFRSLDYQWNSIDGKRGFSSSAGLNAELSGMEIFAINEIYKGLTGQNVRFSLGDVEYARFFKVGGFYTARQRLGSKTSFAARLHTELGRPYGPNGQVPYVYQVFAGGPNSIRAWSLRELGPGAFYDTIASAPDYNNPYYQTGDWLIELNSELRFPLFWYFNGAVFLDAGNLWLLEKDSLRPNGEINANWHKQIAVGSGFGIRLDVSYFILRFDFGYKFRNPYPDLDGNYWIRRRISEVSGKDFTYNIQVGLPF